MFYIGIDPGINGACAILDEKENLKVFRCPKDVRGMSNILYDYSFEECRCIIEKVWSFPGQGVVSTFTFGRNFGQWEGILSSFSIDYIQVIPKKWMSQYKDLSKDKKIRKKQLKEEATKLHPEEKVTLVNADAILIAHYCKNGGMYEQEL